MVYQVTEKDLEEALEWLMNSPDFHLFRQDCISESNKRLDLCRSKMAVSQEIMTSLSVILKLIEGHPNIDFVRNLEESRIYFIKTLAVAWKNGAMNAN